MGTSSTIQSMFSNCYTWAPPLPYRVCLVTVLYVGTSSTSIYMYTVVQSMFSNCAIHGHVPPLPVYITVVFLEWQYIFHTIIHKQAPILAKLHATLCDTSSKMVTNSTHHYQDATNITGSEICCNKILVLLY